jgi:hypothetical protein
MVVYVFTKALQNVFPGEAEFLNFSQYFLIKL